MTTSSEEPGQESDRWSPIGGRGCFWCGNTDGVQDPAEGSELQPGSVVCSDAKACSVRFAAINTMPAQTWEGHGRPQLGVWWGSATPTPGWPDDMMGRACVAHEVPGGFVRFDSARGISIKVRSDYRFRFAKARVEEREGRAPESAPYDSRPETFSHSLRVAALMVDMLEEAMRRSVQHDLSKTKPPEVEVFDKCTPKLKGLTYGSPEYTESLRELGPALAHHYENNRHHPEHHGRGVNGMTLVDLMEMIADWKASTERMAEGDLRRSVRINMARFGIGEQLAGILLNTAEHFRWIDAEEKE